MSHTMNDCAVESHLLPEEQSRPQSGPGKDAIERGRAFLPALLLVSTPMLGIGLVTAPTSEPREKVQYQSISVHLATHDSKKKAVESFETAQKKGKTVEAGSSAEGVRHVYLSEVVRRIEAAKRYPRRELAAGIEDRVTVRLRIRSDGTVQECQLTGQSRYPGFNHEALASIRRAGPFPPFPPEFNERETVLHVTLDFRMH